MTPELMTVIVFGLFLAVHHILEWIEIRLKKKLNKRMKEHAELVNSRRILREFVDSVKLTESADKQGGNN